MILRVVIEPAVEVTQKMKECATVAAFKGLPMESINPVLQRYVNGWKKGNESEILETLAEDCIIIESHGPTYRGKKIVKKWIEDWHRQGNIVEKWNITSFHKCDDLVVFEWVFAYKGKKIREAFEGVSLVKLKNNKISELREYRATQFPFMWGLQAQ